MKSATWYIPSLCSLILLTACKGPSASVPAVKPLDARSLMETIRSTSRPYVVVNFYATWCKPCLKELPELVALQQDEARESDVILVSVDEPAALARQLPEFLAARQIHFPSYHMPPAEAQAAIFTLYPEWNTAIPLNLIYSSADGRLVEATGITNRDELAMIIRMDQSFRP